MPLPAALLKRLAKRGLVNDAKDEEIIAESYDEINENPENYGNPGIVKRDENVWAERLKRRFQSQTVKGVKGCANKYNVHHRCSMFCAEKFGDGNSEPSKAYKIRFKRLTDRYQVPKDWITVYDPGCSAYYFWNKIDDMVSWLPPTHPKAHISKSAATLRQQIEIDDRSFDDNDQTSSAQVSQPDNNHPTMEETPEKYKSSLPVIKKPKSRDLEKVLKSKHDRRSRRTTRRDNRESDKVDPMDPSSYSTCPRGKWSAGLNADEKTAVDPTAPGGAPFQQRPLPSPGDIMRANMKNKKRNSENENSDEEFKAQSGINEDSDMDDANSD